MIVYINQYSYFVLFLFIISIILVLNTIRSFNSFSDGCDENAIPVNALSTRPVSSVSWKLRNEKSASREAVVWAADRISTNVNLVGEYSRESSPWILQCQLHSSTYSISLNFFVLSTLVRVASSAFLAARTADMYAWAEVILAMFSFDNSECMLWSSSII